MDRFRKYLPLSVFLLLIASISALAKDKGKAAPSFLEAVTVNFSKWDSDKDQTLSNEELDAAIEDLENKGPAAAALATLKRLWTSPQIPLSLTNIQALANRPEDAEHEAFQPAYARFLRRINRVTHRELFASALPKVEAIHQGRIANCFCLAPLGAMIHRDPRSVVALFTNVAEDQILVKFPGGPITVASVSDAELAMTSGSSEDGTWINVYEKAIGKARNDRRLPDQQFDLPMDAIARGGTPGTVITYLTGHKVTGFSIKAETDLAELRKKVAKGAAEKRLMSCETEEVTTPGLTDKHAYALLDFHSDSDLLEVWNPHGDDFTPNGPPGLTNGYPTTHGLFTIPVTEFVHQFSHVSIEGSERATRQWVDQWPVLAQRGKFKDAAADLAEMIALDPSEDWRVYMLTPLLVEAGQTGDFRVHCQTMLNQFEKTSVPSVAERTAKSCLLVASTVGANDLARAAALAVHAVTLSKSNDWMHWRYMTRALAEYRLHRYADCLVTLPLSRNDPSTHRDRAGNACEADTYFISAMAHQRLGQKNEAREDLNFALKIMDEKLPKLDSGDLTPAWFDVLMTFILRHEAVETINGPTMSKRK